MTTIPEQAVIQADRDCAENAIRAWVLMGANDDAWPAILAQAFATQRLAATKSTDCGCGMGVLCFRDRREPALGKIAFAIIEGSAGLRAAEHAKEFQTGNWRDALRSAQAVSRLAHSQPASDGLRERIVEILHKRRMCCVNEGKIVAQEILAALQPLTEPQRLGQEGFDAIDTVLRYHESGGHEGDGSDKALLGARKSLAALSTPAQAEPVAWMYHHPGDLEQGWQRYSFERRIQSYEGMSCIEEDAGLIETPLYAHPPAPPQDREAVVERMAEAIEAARCPHREGPFGGYDYGYPDNKPIEGGRFVIRDFRDPNSPDWGKWLHQTDDKDEHETMFTRMTQHHVAKAALDAALPLLAEERGERS